jgi:transglutaminase-like putative cysteine protease
VAVTSSAIRLRPAPPLLTGAGLLLWGWQTGFLPYALPMALLLEMSYWTSWRWSITDKEFNNVADISGVVFFLVVVYIFIRNGANGIFAVLSIMPFILYMLILVQRYSQQGAIKLSALFISLRRLEATEAKDINREIDLSLPYLLVCIISASSGNQRTIWFFVSCCLLVAAVLWSFRPRRYHYGLWIVLISLSFLLSYGGQIGIFKLHRSIEISVMQLFERYMWRYRDPNRATTAIGTIGRLKLSDSIVLRIDTKRLTHPLLLREASYSSYGFGVWSNIDTQFDLIDPDITPGNWTLDKHTGDSSVVIATYMTKETGVIPLPQGITNIRDSNAIEINRNHYGAVRMEAREGWVRYRALYQPGKIDDPPPNNRDLAIAETYRPDFQRLAREWDLHGKQPREILQTVKHNFAENFRYSLTRRNRYPRGKYLHNFLFNNRQGHCEFFATSTVLLLRAAGIPARYAVGYVVDEYSRLESRYIVRARDAHSWALAFVDGSWQVVDTTPSVWGAEGDAEASALEPLFDFASWVKYRFARWQSGDMTEEKASGNFLLWLLVPLVLLLIWRLYGKQRISRIKTGDDKRENAVYPGMDSALYSLIRELEQAGYYRRQGETLRAWFARLDEEIKCSSLNDALQLHYRYRFDPASNDAELRRRLTERVEAILASDLTPAQDR